jgi:hypothetical protein
MPQRDYILRLIEQAAVVLKELVDRLRGRAASREEVLRTLKQAAFLGNLDLDLLRVLDANAVRMIATQVGQGDPARIWLAAETLYLDGISARLEGNGSRGTASLAKALMLFRMVEPSVTLPVGFSEAAERIQEIEALLSEPERDDAA